MSLPPVLDRRFEAALFDWDGTAVPDRNADATRVRRAVEALCARGFDVIVVSGTHVANVDAQLGARPPGPGRLHLCLNRGSEVFRVDREGVHLVHRRVATPDEDVALTRAAATAVRRLAERGLAAAVVAERLNRRKIDLIPEPGWADPPKARLGELVEAVQQRLGRAGIEGLEEAAAIARTAALEAGLPDPRVTSDAKHVEIGLTDKSDSARFAFGGLAARGIGPSLVLVAGDELGPIGGLPGSDSLLLIPEAARATAVSVGPEPAGVPPGVVALGGGPDAFLALLEDQLLRRVERRVPRVDADPAWSLSIEGLDPALERVHEALLTLADGRLGTSGTPLAHHPAATPGVLAAGVYTAEGPETELLQGPAWNLLAWELPPDPELVRVLDLRTGLLRQELATDGGPVCTLLLSSLARPGTVALRAEGPRQLLQSAAPLAPPLDHEERGAGKVDGYRYLRVAPGRGGIVAAAAEAVRELGGGRRSLERLAAYVADPDLAPTPEDAAVVLRRDDEVGYETLLAEHREAWAQRWEDADVVIEGDPDLQRSVRFALFHLMASVARTGEAAVGARGLSGPAYRGHVFWDADVYVLPFLAATCPEAARAMLEYRLARLPAARTIAAEAGYAGARFPWESAASGLDVTPRSTRDRTGRAAPILTGLEEEHVVADVAWAAACYADWSGDRAFAAGPGLALLVETARYWASRLRLDPDGRGHIDGVIGPDEYHEHVSDNAFTNVMARWNLRRAAAGAQGAVPDAEIQAWLGAAAALVDGYDESSGLYEQFAGFFGLEPLVILDLAPKRPVMAEALLGRERVQAAQVVKQADVLMLHHLVPGEVAPGSLEPNLAFYEPRTAHGSSLSPGVHAALLARAGRLGEAVDWLRLASRIDLDDLTATTAGGLHLAAMGSVWQALAFGFLGLSPGPEALALDPRLPEGWDALEVRVRFRGSRLRIRAERDEVRVVAEPPAPLLVAGKRLVAGPEGLRVGYPADASGRVQV